MESNSLRTLCEIYESGKLHTSSQFHDRNVVSDIANSFKEKSARAICFNIGNRSSMTGIQIIPELFKLPYDVCWFEGERLAPKSVSLRVGFLCYNKDDATIATQIYVKSEKIGLNHWGLMFSIDSTINKELGEVWHLCVPKSESNEDVCADVMRWLGAFLSAINCINIRRVKHSPDLALQKARIKRGKKPLFETWTLEIDLSKSDKDTVGLGGTHASPRVHLRRGHARQHREGHWCWVQPHIVGSKDAGMIYKDYSVKPNDDRKAA